MSNSDDCAVKMCSRCGVLKEKSDFSPKSFLPLSGWCKSCHCEARNAARELQKGVPEDCKRCKTCSKVKPLDQFSVSTKGRKRTAPSCKKCTARLAKESRKARPEKLRANLLMRCYRMTPGDYDKKLAEQEGKCAICRSEPKPGKHLQVDHDHKCCPRIDGRQGSIVTCGQCVRGLLCYSCNVMVGKLENGYILPFVGYIEMWGGGDNLQLRY